MTGGSGGRKPPVSYAAGIICRRYYFMSLRTSLYQSCAAIRHKETCNAAGMYATTATHGAHSRTLFNRMRQQSMSWQYFRSAGNQTFCPFDEKAVN
jgi:hypothetical protein